jgi:hypothetical protein
MVIIGSFLASDFRGFASRYIRSTSRKNNPLATDDSRIVKAYRLRFAGGAALGVLLLISGILRL